METRLASVVQRQLSGSCVLRVGIPGVSRRTYLKKMFSTICRIYIEYIHSVANAFDCLLDILLDSTNSPGEQEVNDKRWHVPLPGVWYQVISQSFCALVSHTEREAVTRVYLINLLWRLNTFKKLYSSPWHRVFSNSCCHRVNFSCWKI